MTGEGWALAAAVAAWVALARPAAWEAWAGAAAGVFLGAPGVALGGMLAGLAVAEFQRRETRVVAQDRRDAATERLLQQILVAARPGMGLSAALDQVGVRRRGRDDSVLDGLWDEHPSPALLRAKPALEAVERYGGSLSQLLRETADHVRRDRRLRWDLEAEMAGSRLTLLVMSLAPWAVLGMFRVALPTFYGVVADTGVGMGLLVWCGASAWALQWLSGRGGADG